MSPIPFLDVPQFYRRLNQTNETLVLVSFWVDWVGPCHTIHDRLKMARDQYNVDCYRVDGDESSELVTQFDVRYYPTNLLLKNGRVTDRLVGGDAEGALDSFLMKNMEAVDARRTA